MDYLHTILDFKIILYFWIKIFGFSPKCTRFFFVADPSKKLAKPPGVLCNEAEWMKTVGIYSFADGEYEKVGNFPVRLTEEKANILYVKKVVSEESLSFSIIVFIPSCFFTFSSSLPFYILKISSLLVSFVFIWNLQFHIKFNVLFLLIMYFVL